MNFGNVLSSDTLNERYWNARQSDSETVTSWGCRLEELLSQLTDKGAISSDTRVSMLRSKFFNGLQSETMKARLQHHFDMGSPYETLLKSARNLEADTKGESKPTRAKIAPVQTLKPMQQTVKLLGS